MAYNVGGQVVKKFVAIALALLFVASTSAMAGVITLKADRDSQLVDAGCGGNSNKGNGGKFYYSTASTDWLSDTVVLSWDLSEVTLGPGEYVASGFVTLYNSAGGPSNYAWHVKCFPLKKTWVEGVGVPPDGFGGGGYPWGPCQVGDSCKNYQVVRTTTVTGDNWVELATDGLAWQVPGATGDDDCDKTRPFVDADLVGAGVSGVGSPLGDLPLTDDGCDVVEEWITGGLDNNGIVLMLASFRDGGSVMHLGTRESGCTGPDQCPGASAAELTLEIVPEPATIALLGLGVVGLIRRRR